MAKATKPKKKGKYNTTIKVDMTADELLNKMLNTPMKNSKVKKGK